MNNVSLVGRLTRPIELHQSQTDSAMSMCNLNVAVDRRFKKEGQDNADFINCKAFGKTAEFVSKYFTKGQRIGLVGRIQTGSYEKDGKKVYTTDVIVENVEFVDSKNDSNKDEKENFTKATSSLEDCELPFN